MKQLCPFSETPKVWYLCGYLPWGGHTCADSLINHIDVHLSLRHVMAISNGKVQHPFIAASWLVQFMQTVLFYRETAWRKGRALLVSWLLASCPYGCQNAALVFWGSVHLMYSINLHTIENYKFINKTETIKVTLCGFPSAPVLLEL